MTKIQVPLTGIKCGKWYKKTHCTLSVQKSSRKLGFTLKDGDETVNFECTDISGVDLRVEAKFGAIDAMKGSLVVECLYPVVVNILRAGSSATSCGGDSCLLRATFDITETAAVRNALCELRNAYSHPQLLRKIEKTDSNNTTTKTASLKEGLPVWVTYIPHSLYSKRLRQYIELAIFVYIIFSVMWALWQLYNHVDFVRESVAPLIEMVKYQYQLLDNMVHVLNTIFEEYTTKWLCFIKPLYTLTTTLASPLIAMISQLCPLMRTIPRAFSSIWAVTKPVARPILLVAYQLCKSTWAALGTLKALISRACLPFLNSSIPVALRNNVKALKRLAGVMCHTLYNANHFDPLKAQLVVMRTTVINSCKALGFAVIHLARQMYKFIWLRKSAKNAKKD